MTSTEKNTTQHGLGPASTNPIRRYVLSLRVQIINGGAQTLCALHQVVWSLPGALRQIAEMPQAPLALVGDVVEIDYAQNETADST